MNDTLQRLKDNARIRHNLGASTWLMHDHRWAFYCWEAECEKTPHTLLHIDYHWDAINDFKKPDDVKTLLKASLSEIESWTEDWSGRIRYDNFIAPAILRGLVNEVHFLCEQNYGDAGLWPPLLESYGASQTLHSSVDLLLQSLHDVQQPTIFDLDLDLFNRHSQYFGKELDVISQLAPFITSAAVVTIATSRLNAWKKDDDVEKMTWDEKIADRVTERVVAAIQRLRPQ